MVNDLGVKSLILISRSGIDAPGAADAVEALRRTDVAITVRKCDVADTESLLTLHQDFADTLPPIRGVVQCAMVLRVSAAIESAPPTSDRKPSANLVQLGRDLP